jgi:type I restriction enzyme S subunit
LSIQTELKSYDNEGTVFGSINKDTLGGLKTIVPVLDLIERFDQLIKPIDDQIETLSKETESLKNLRDTLLPKLISGELEVNESLLEPTF